MQLFCTWMNSSPLDWMRPSGRSTEHNERRLLGCVGISGNPFLISVGLSKASPLKKRNIFGKSSGVIIEGGQTNFAIWNEPPELRCLGIAQLRQIWQRGRLQLNGQRER